MAQKPDVTGREILPIPDIPSKGKMALDARKAEFPATKPLRPPEGAPNVVIVLIDGFGDLLHTWGWQRCFTREHKPGLLRLWWPHLAGSAVNYVTPTATLGGEVIKGTLVPRGIPGPEVAASLTINKLTVTLADLILAVAGVSVLVASAPRTLLQRSSIFARSSLRISSVLDALTRSLRPSRISTSSFFTSAMRSVGSSSVVSLTCALMIMKNRITAPKPQLMQSRNDMLKTSNWRRLRAIPGLRHDETKLVAGTPQPNQVTDLQHGRPVDLVAIEKRSVAAVVLHDALAVPALDGTMPAGYAGHLAAQVDPALAGCGLRAQQQRPATSRRP